MNTFGSNMTSYATTKTGTGSFLGIAPVELAIRVGNGTIYGCVQVGNDARNVTWLLRGSFSFVESNHSFIDFSFDWGISR